MCWPCDQPTPITTHLGRPIVGAGTGNRIDGTMQHSHTHLCCMRARACALARRHARYAHAHVRACVHLCELVNACACIGLRVGKHRLRVGNGGLFVDTCMDVCVDMCMDVCMDMCMDMSSDICTGMYKTWRQTCV